jgi:hypothetical protein
MRCFKFVILVTIIVVMSLSTLLTMRPDARAGDILQGLLLQLIPGHALLFLVVLTALLLLITLVFILQALVIAACVALALLLLPITRFD